jgi:hypothetical protein
MALMYLICENCLQVVARFDPAAATIPVESGIFESHLADRGVPPPWQPGVDPAWMRCPVCPKRVFNVPNPMALYVSAGPDGVVPHYLDIDVAIIADEPSAGGYVCPDCGREYTSQDNYERYHKCKERSDVTD